MARVDVAEFANFYVEPGELLLRIGRDPEGGGLCGVDQENWTQRETIMKSGDKKTFRMSIDVNGKLDIMRADLDQPKKETIMQEMLLEFTKEMEIKLKRYPEQWFNYYNFWN